MNAFRRAAIAGVIAAAIVGLVTPAQTTTAADAGMASMTNISNGIAHHAWIDHNQPHVNVPDVDTNVSQSR
jgi:hypothetical protein